MTRANERLDSNDECNVNNGEFSTDQFAQLSQLNDLSTIDNSNDTRLCYKFTPLAMWDHTRTNWVQIDSLTNQTIVDKTQIQHIMQVPSPSGTTLYALAAFTPVPADDSIDSTSSTFTGHFQSYTQDSLQPAFPNNQSVSESSTEVSAESIMDGQTNSSFILCGKDNTPRQRLSPLTKTSEHVISGRSSHNIIDNRDPAAGISPTCATSPCMQSLGPVMSKDETSFEAFCEKLAVPLSFSMPKVDLANRPDKADLTPRITSIREIQSSGVQDSQSFFQATDELKSNSNLDSTTSVENLRKDQFTHCSRKSDGKYNSNDTLEMELDGPNGERFEHEDDIRVHVEIHGQENDRSAPSSDTSQSLYCSTKGRNNKRDTRGKLLHKCYFRRCRSKFTKISHLKVHIKNHTFVCSWAACKSTIMGKLSFIEHEKIHKNCPCLNCSNKKEVFDSYFAHVCHIPGCNKKFRYGKSFLVHLEKHDGEKKFTCDYCDKKFATKITLIPHIIRHTVPLYGTRNSRVKKHTVSRPL